MARYLDGAKSLVGFSRISTKKGGVKVIEGRGNRLKGIINEKLTDDLNQDQWRREGNLYEVLRIVDGVPLFLKEHLERLESGGGKLDHRSVADSLRLLISTVASDVSQNVFMSIEPESGQLALFFIDSFYPPIEWYSRGVPVGLLKIRRKDPSKKVYDSKYKQTISNYLAMTGYFETLISDDGLIREGSRSNVFFVQNDFLITPSISEALPGITRKMVLKAVDNVGGKLVERPISVEEIADFDGAFITGTSIDLLPVSRIEEICLESATNPYFKQYQAAYAALKKEDLCRYAW